MSNIVSIHLPTELKEQLPVLAKFYSSSSGTDSISGFVRWLVEQAEASMKELLANSKPISFSEQAISKPISIDNWPIRKGTHLDAERITPDDCCPVCGQELEEVLDDNLGYIVCCQKDKYFKPRNVSGRYSSVD
jgi:hypothetical protein